MRLFFKMTLTTTVLLGLLATTTRVCLASEPLNNNPPWASGALWHPDVSSYISEGTGRSWGTPESISSSTDVDYLVVACAASTLNSVSISFHHQFGDLDIQAYTLGGSYISISQGTGDTETIPLSSQGKNAVVLYVYGYQGATNPYDISINCN